MVNKERTVTLYFTIKVNMDFSIPIASIVKHKTGGKIQKIRPTHAFLCPKIED